MPRRGFVRFSVVLALILGFWGCDSTTDACDPSDSACGSSGPVPATITVEPELVALTVGATRQLELTARDQYGDTIHGATVIWVSTNQSVATVSATGLVRAEGLGTTRVHATPDGTTISTVDVGVCPLHGTMTFGGFRLDSLVTTDCWLPDGRWTDWLTLEIDQAAAGPVQIDLLSLTIHTSLHLLGPNASVISEHHRHETELLIPYYDSGGRVRQNLSAGSYTIVAAGWSPTRRGAYQLSVGPGLRCPEEGPIAIGASTTGQSLAGDDCSREQVFADVYVVRVLDTNTVTFTLTSPDFDAYLTLLDPSGNVVFSDDNGAGGTDARISRTLQPAFYIIEVSSASPGDTGSYTLTVD